MATHCSVLAWRIPWIEPGGLQSVGSQKSWTQVKRLSTHAHGAWVVYVQGSYSSGVCICRYWELETAGPCSTSRSLSFHIDCWFGGWMQASVSTRSSR